jgi:hypothetical protein
VRSGVALFQPFFHTAQISDEPIPGTGYNALVQMLFVVS